MKNHHTAAELVRSAARSLAAAVIAALTLCSMAGAQQTSESPSTRRLIVGGAAIGAVGYVTGAYAGRAMESRIVCDSFTAQHCRRSGIGELIGAVVGGSTGVAAGVHLANDQQGSFGRDWLYAIGVGAAGAATVVGIARAVLDEETRSPTAEIGLAAAYLIIVPAAQIAAVIQLERQEGRSGGRGPQYRVPLLTVRIPVR